MSYVFNVTVGHHKIKTSFFLVQQPPPPRGAMASLFLWSLDHTQRRTTVGRTPPDVRSARRRDLYLTTHNTHKKQTSMPPVGFEPTIPAGGRPQTYALNRAFTGTGSSKLLLISYLIYQSLNTRTLVLVASSGQVCIILLERCIIGVL
jgi:hypothetical protein